MAMTGPDSGTGPVGTVPPAEQPADLAAERPRSLLRWLGDRWAATPDAAEAGMSTAEYAVGAEFALCHA